MGKKWEVIDVQNESCHCISQDIQTLSVDNETKFQYCHYEHKTKVLKSDSKNSKLCKIMKFVEHKWELSKI